MQYNFQVYLSNANDLNLGSKTASTIYRNGAPTLGSGTCTPNALKFAYEYIMGKGEEPTNVVILTDLEMIVIDGIVQHLIMDMDNQEKL